MEQNRTTNPDGGSSTTVISSGEKSSGNGGLWFIVGGVLVALAVVAYLVTGGEIGVFSNGSSPSGDVSVTIEGDSAAPSSTVVTEPPAAEAPAAEAPAAEAPAAGASTTTP